MSAARLKFRRGHTGKKEQASDRRRPERLRYAPPANVLQASDLRLHLLFPHEAWARGTERMRLDFLRGYMDYIVGLGDTRTLNIITLPAGFHRKHDLLGVQATMESELAAYRSRAILLSAGIDTPDEKEYSYLVDLSGPSIKWPVVVEKFNREDPRGNPEDPRSCIWKGLQVFALCCKDCTCGLWSEPPKSLAWAADAAFHVVLDNAHYSGRRGQGIWDVGYVGPLTRGLGRMVKRPEITGKRAGLAAIAFYTDRSPLEGTGRWWYGTSTRVKVRLLDFRTGKGLAAVWHRVIHIDLLKAGVGSAAVFASSRGAGTQARPRSTSMDRKGNFRRRHE